MSNNGGPAFPSPVVRVEEDGTIHYEDAQDGMSVRDYFAAHAPVERWPHFKPLVELSPKAPSIDIATYAPAGLILTVQQWDYARQLADNWRGDPHWDLSTFPTDGGGTPEYVEAIELARPALAAFESAWRTYWNDDLAWLQRCELARLSQWPWFYADAMLAERERAS